MKVGEFLKAISEGRGEPFITARLMRADGSVFTGEISLFARKTGGGELLGYTGSIRDISRRMLLEEQVRQSQKMEAIGQLAGGIAHDFNNLLTIINGYAYMLLADIPDDDRRRGELEEIRKAGHRAASLTRQLLAFSRKQILQPEAIDINARIRDTESMLTRLIGEHILLETRLCPEKLVVMADPGQFDQIIINLAVNARDAMPRGGRLSIETQPVEIGLDEASDKALDSYGSYALIRVVDNGCGIPTENIPHVFEPFFTTKATGEGTGMGLPTVFGILKQSKGDISVESSPGNGSVFTVILPRVDVPESASNEDADPAGRRSSGEIIVLAEDEESVRDLIRSSLELGGFSVVEAENGKAALGILRSMEKPPDLLLTDVMMPEMSGRELARGMRELFPDTPVCFMSGYTDETIERLELLESGASFIQKPFLPGELIEMVRRIIDGNRA
jgi:signal transduction histidine kinase